MKSTLLLKINSLLDLSKMCGIYLIKNNFEVFFPNFREKKPMVNVSSQWSMVKQTTRERQDLINGTEGIILFIWFQHGA